MDCLTSSIFFRNEPIWLAHHSKKIECMGPSQNRRFYIGVHSSLPLAQLYRLKEDNSCRTIWYKSEVLLGTPLGNTMRTWWEHVGNKGIWKKSSPTPPPQNPNPKLKGKKTRHFECMLSLPIGYMNFLFPKLFVTIFGLG